MVAIDPCPWVPARNARTISEAYAVCKTAPTGADLVIDIEYSDDDGDTWTSIWNSTPANRLTIAAGATAGSQTDFDTTTIAVGSLVRVAVDQVGSTVAGADLTVTLKF